MDFMQRATRIVDITTGQADEPRQPSARANALRIGQRSEIACKAAAVRRQKPDAV